MTDTRKTTYRVMVAYFVEAESEAEAIGAVLGKVDPSRDDTDHPEAWSAEVWDLEG